MGWEFWLGVAVGAAAGVFIGAALFIWWAAGIGKR